MTHQPTPTWEQLGDQLLLLDPEQQVILRFEGTAADLAGRLLRGEVAPGDVNDELHLSVFESLAAAGALPPAAPTSTPARRMNRRSAIATGAAFGITVLALPVAAAANSGAAPAGGGDGITSTSSTTASSTSSTTESTTTTTDPDAPTEGFAAQSAVPVSSGTVEVTGTDGAA